MTHPRSGNWSTHASVYLTWLVPAVVVVLLAFFQPWVGTPVSFKDVVVVAGGEFYFGLILDLGILLFCVTTAICLFTACVASQQADRRSIAHLYSAGGLTTLLTVDVLFLLHKNVLPDLVGIPRPIVMVV